MFSKWGICLSGGGGKGAYQIGVWQALRDQGLDQKISAISGTSVGGLNGAMLAQNKFEQARDMWLNIESRNMLSVQDVPALASQLTRLTASGVLSPVLAQFISTKGLFKQDGLKSMIEEGLDAGRLAASALPLTVALHHTEANRVDYLDLRDAETAADILLGTAALPFIFDEVKLGSATYTDGGFYWGLPHKNVDNTPIKPLVEAGCDTILVVHLSPDDLSVDPRDYPGVRILPIVPTGNLGGLGPTLDFSNEGAARRIEQGHADALQLLRHLELFLGSETQYQTLWERVRFACEQERNLGNRLAEADKQHARTVSDIKDFDCHIQQNDFLSPLDVADDDEAPLALDQLTLENTALLADIERQQIETAVESFLVQNGNNRPQLESAVMDALAALAPVSGRAANLRDQGLMSRLWGSITGSNQRIAASSDHDLAQAQFAALRLIASVHEKGAITLEFTCALQNRLNSAFAEIGRFGERHNRDLRRVYRSLAGVYSKLRDGIVQHENRLDALERQGRLHHWLLHPNRARIDGKPLAQLPVELQLACIANDFYRLTEGNWSVSELVSLKEMCINIGLDDRRPVQVASFCCQLAADPLPAQTLSQQLAVLPEARHRPGQVASWLRDLRERRIEPCSGEQALAPWGYSQHSELPAWNFLAELLYHLKDAGFAVVHSSDIGRYKAIWLKQIDTLEALVADKILPSGFNQEIGELRAAIDGFHLKVPLIGKFSVGKSTLLNCWLGAEIQKDDLGACTSLATEFHYAEAGGEKLVVHWIDDASQGSIRREERPLASYEALLADPRTAANPPLFVELHLNRSALARHPDLILVDTPGFGSGRGDHERALQQYIGEGVASILCVTRISQVGIDELGFINRQRSLGQDFSLLVCQEAFNTPSQRDQLRRQLAEQAGLESRQLVRGCSAREGDLSGFDDLLARLETRKADLFHANLAPRVQALLARAEQLIRKQLALDATQDQLRDQRRQIDRSRSRLDQNFRDERDRLLRDCRGSVTGQVIATVNSYLRSRRSAYAGMLLAGQGIGPLLTADARNASQLAVEQCLTPRFKSSCQNLGSHVELDGGDAPLLAGADAAGLESDNGLGGPAAGAAAGAAIGSMLPVIGTLVGGLIGGLVGFFGSRSSKESEAEGKASEAVESIIRQLEAALPDFLEQQASRFIDRMHARISAQLDAQQQNIERIDEQISADEQRRSQVKARAEQALGQVAALLEQQMILSV